MKRFDAFFALNFFLAGVLTYTFYFASTSLDLFDRDPHLKARYERQKELNVLNKELSELAKTSAVKRSMASIRTGDSDVVNSVSHLSTDANDVARNYFSKAKEYCYEPAKESECVSTIDTVITQFPESVWAGESLLVLTDLYRRTNRASQIPDIVKVLKTDFKQYKSVQVKVEYLEKQTL
jgi:hypothetical protein